MKRSTLLYGAAAAVAAVLALAWAFAPRPVPVEVAQVTRGHFEATVDEDARTRLRDRYVVSAPLAGRLDRITLREGDAVAAEAPVASLTPLLSPLLDERTLREQQARVDAAGANVARAVARTERAKVGLQQASNDVRRTEELARQGFVSPTKLDTDRLAVQAAQRELEAAQAERHVAAHELEQARAALVAVQQPGSAAARAFVVRSPVAGQVLRVPQQSEATVALGAPLLEIGDISQLEIVAELLTTDALQARPGCRVIIERWGGPGLLEGRVRLVEPSAFTKISALGVEEQRVKVLIDLTSPRERWAALGDGYRVGVRIVTQSVDGVLKLPVSAVFPVEGAAARPDADSGDERANGGAFAVFALENGRARLRRVEVAARNGSEAWIRSGIDAGATVIVYPPAQVSDGVRVRVRQV
jgi:HlyD family secretion protein